MSANSGGARASWSGKWAFILAAAASAIGLGNLWRFPYLAAKYGGGVFLITYVVLVVTFGFTLMMLEAALGRKTGRVRLVPLSLSGRNMPSLASSLQRFRSSLCRITASSVVGCSSTLVRTLSMALRRLPMAVHTYQLHWRWRRELHLAIAFLLIVSLLLRWA